MIIWDKAEVIKVSDNALEHLAVPCGDKGCRYCTKMLRWGKQRHSAFAFQAEIDQLLSLNINTFCYTVMLEEIVMMISDGNSHIDLNAVWDVRAFLKAFPSPLTSL
ncbi:uncharacterized protein LOC131335329 isoform X2 [Rhododendron vialii]|uniref:uncharacterized protein LOC131335329 isoform X2 n=1 Tax=Rhododendron vialii TaxID=182163 RepID=UPI00265E524D|nr:uncharacterized protein LOC131335329 isoform X2 [Rhododendron vialii]